MASIKCTHAHSDAASCTAETSLVRPDAYRTSATQASPVKVDGGTGGSVNCAELGRASLRCIEEHGYNRAAPECKKHYDAYRECKKAMTEERRKPTKSLF